MAHSTFSRALPQSRTVGWLDALRNGIARRAVYQRTLRELSALSNRDLADLGIDRKMITRVANEAAYGVTQKN